MSHWKFSREQISCFRDSAHRLARQAADIEEILRLLVSTDPADLDTVRQLRADARVHRLATDQLATELGDGQVPRDIKSPLPCAVLIADDYDDSREFLSMLLHDAGFIVRTASNGLEALIVAHEVQPAVIVMDLMMPVLDGVEATRLIKAIDQLRDARVIAYTAKPVDSKMIEQLFAAVLAKPSPPEIVLATVQRCAESLNP
jgi:CheY-like chemotaxis protein